MIFYVLQFYLVAKFTLLQACFPMYEFIQFQNYIDMFQYDPR